jgi:hypothetical protein
MPNPYDNYERQENNELAYDLRQRYAKLVGDHIEMIAVFRVQQKYSEWLNAMDNLYTIIEFKFLDRTKKKDLTFEDIKELHEAYEKLIREVLEVANKFKSTWFNKSKEPEHISKIESALRSVERWLYFKMNEANMFGSKREIESLI